MDKVKSINIPEYCYSLNNMTIDPKTRVGDVIRVKAFEEGYYKTTMTLTQEEVDKLNDGLGITKPQAQAMESASLFGWKVYKNCLESFEKLQERTK